MIPKNEAVRVFRKCLRNEIERISIGEAMDDAFGFTPLPFYGASRERLERIRTRLGVSNHDILSYLFDASDTEGKFAGHNVPAAYCEMVIYESELMVAGKEEKR